MSEFAYRQPDGSWVTTDGRTLSPPPPGWSANGIPPVGSVLWGTCGTNRPTTISPTYGEAAIAQSEEKWAGVTANKAGIHRMYMDSTLSTATVRSAIDNAHSKGRIPWVSFKLSTYGGTGWTQAIAGQFDSWATSMAASLGQASGPVWVCLHHEPEGDGSIADWQGMNARLLPIFKAQPNIATSIITMGYPQTVAGGGEEWGDMWPAGGQAYIDIWALDPYNWWDSNANPGGNFVEVMSYYIGRMKTWLNAQGSALNGLKIAIAEFGLTDTASQIPQNYNDTSTANPRYSYDAVYTNKVQATAGPGWEYMQRQYAAAVNTYSTAAHQFVALVYYDFTLTDRMFWSTAQHKADAGAVALIAPRYPF